MKKLAIKTTFLRHRYLWYGVAALALLALVGYVVYSYLAWQSYDDRYAAWSRASAGQIAGGLNKPLGEQGSVSAKLSELEAIEVQLHREAADVCRPPAATGWQSMIDGVEQRITDCREAADEISREAERLAVLVSYLGLESKLAEIINTTAATEAATSELWPQAQAAWQKAAEDIAKLEGGEAGNKLRDAAADHVRRVAEAWQVLIDADSAKDQVALEEARAAITGRYGELTKALSDQSAAIINSL